MSDRQKARREAAAAIGLCASCTKIPARPGCRCCDACIEASRRAKERRRNRLQQQQPARVRAGARVVVSDVPFDIEADRREEWLALNDLAISRYIGSFPWVA